MNSQSPLSEREAKLAAEMGKPIPAKIQNQVLEKAKEDTKKRVAELNRMQAEERAKAEEARRIANLPPMGKRMQQQYNQQRTEQTFNNSNVNSTQPEINNFQQFKNEHMFNSVNDQNYQQYEQATRDENIHRERFQTTNIPKIVQEDIRNIAVNNSNLFTPALYTNKTKKERIDKMPSQFLSYPENAEIYITPYSGDDVDELSNSNLPLKHILTRCMEGVYTNFDKNLITFYDALYLSLNRRILSISPEDNKIQILTQCPYCQKWSTTIVDINTQIEFEDIKIPTLPINVEFSFGRLQFGFLTYGDYMKLQTDLRSEELAYQCLTPCNVDTEQGQTQAEELQKLFGSLVGEDQALLTKVRELTYHGVKPINTLCQNTECGKTYNSYMDEMSCIISPFRKPSQDIRSKVSFG